MTLKEFLSNPFVIMLCMGIISFALTVYNNAQHKKNSSAETIKDGLECKVDKDDCHSFRRRIGKESDDNREDIQKLQQGLAFLVGRAGGDPQSMGLLN